MTLINRVGLGSQFQFSLTHFVFFVDQFRLVGPGDLRPLKDLINQLAPNLSRPRPSSFSPLVTKAMNALCEKQEHLQLTGSAPGSRRPSSSPPPPPRSRAIPPATPFRATHRKRASPHNPHRSHRSLSPRTRRPWRRSGRRARRRWCIRARWRSWARAWASPVSLPPSGPRAWARRARRSSSRRRRWCLRSTRSTRSTRSFLSFRRTRKWPIPRSCQPLRRTRA